MNQHDMFVEMLQYLKLDQYDHTEGFRTTRIPVYVSTEDWEKLDQRLRASIVENLNILAVSRGYVPSKRPR